MKQLSYLILLAFAALVFSNCGTDDYVWTDDGNDSTSYFSIRMDETELQGAGIYTIYADAALPQAEYTASLGGETINFVLEDGDSSFVFLMPFIDTGSYELIIDSLEANPISVTVVEAEKIDDPNALIQADIAEVDTLINQVNRASKLGYNISESQMAELSNFSAELKTMVNELSAEDKEKLAIFLNANWVHLPDFEPLLIADSLVSNKRAAANPTAELERLSNWFVVSLTTTITTLPPLYKLITVAPANPWALAGAGALAITCGTAFIASQVIAEQIGELRGIPDQLTNELRPKTAFEFSNEAKRAVWPKLNYRTIKREDANSQVGLVADLLGEMLSFESLWKKMKSAVETVEGWIGKKIVSIADSPLNIDDEPDSKYFSPDYNLVEIENVTNGVEMKKYVENGVLKLEAKSDIETDFTFDLVYSDNKYGFEFGDTYAAKVAIPVFELTGTWYLSWYESDSRIKLTQKTSLDAQGGALDTVLAYGYTNDQGWNPYKTWTHGLNGYTQSYSGGKLRLDHNYFSNVLLMFVYDPSEPNRLIGESIGASNKGYNLVLSKN
ncbi:MAG: hypothetical protein JXQ87_08470 [Bacteroidia bacterium]